MAALKVNPDNSITLPFPLLSIILVVFLAIAGWGASIRNDTADNKKEIAELKSWKAEHIKQAESNLADLKGSIRQTNDLVTATAAASTRQNAELQETLTTVRIQMAARH